MGRRFPESGVLVSPAYTVRIVAFAGAWRGSQFLEDPYIFKRRLGTEHVRMTIWYSDIRVALKPDSKS